MQNEGILQGDVGFGVRRVREALEELFEVDPLSPEQIERQKRFLRRFAGIMIASD